jgi:octaheme c-type cytochrome (tetrathionate reductase family)
MSIPNRRNPLLRYIALAVCCLLLTPLTASATPSNDEQAPGRSMARQATKSKKLWRTTDHSKHEILQKDFTSGEELTKACISCHSEAENQFHKTIHWTWLADPSDKKREYGKAGNSMNNYCISTNKTVDNSCLSCHPGWGTSMESSVNCLVCHSQKNMNFDEAMSDIQGFIKDGDEESREMASEIQAELRDAAQAIGLPARQNCGSCHFYGGGGDGVKHGDLDSSLAKPSKTLDVHMGTDGQNFNCTRCHTTTLHNISGRVYTKPAAMDRKSLVEDDLANKITCESCHTSRPHKSGDKMNEHTDKVACQSCHIPEFARVNPTKMSWDWSTSGKLKDGKKFKTKDQFGKHDYLSIKGQMKWEKNIKPEYAWYNGSIQSIIAKDKIDPTGIVKVSWPVGDPNDPNSRIYPFKVHRGNQPYDKINQTLLMPMLSGKQGYWNTLNWDEALTVGQASMGLPFSGKFDFVKTTYVFPITHMVAPKGKSLACKECHSKTDSRLANLAGFYMPGRDGSKLLNAAGWTLVLANLIGVMLHALARVFSRSNGRNGNGRKEE